MDLEWAAQAEADINDIIAYFAEIDPSLPEQIIGRIAAAPLALLDFPFLGQDVGLSGLRKWPVKQTPFIVFYLVERDVVKVARVVHGATNWQSLGD